MNKYKAVGTTILIPVYSVFTSSLAVKKLFSTRKVNVKLNLTNLPLVCICSTAQA